MGLESRRIDIGEGINLNMINVKGLESSLFGVYFIMPLNREEVTKNSLLSLVLKMGTQKYNSNLKVGQRLEELYRARLNTNVKKKGEKQIIGFTIEIPNDEDDKRILDSINFLKDIIYNPYIGEGFSSLQSIEDEKEKLKNIINENKEDITNYSIQRCIEEMYKNDIYSISPLGYIDDLEEIDNIKLYEHYLKILSQTPMEIIFVGEYKDYILEHIKKAYKFDKDNVYSIENGNITGNVQTKNMIYEDKNIKENHLVVGYRTGISYKSPLYNGLLVANQILIDRINREILEISIESNSTPNFFGSTIDKYKSIILIEGSISSISMEEVIKIFWDQIDNMKKGKFTDEDMKNSKKYIRQCFESLKENAILISDYFLDKILTNEDRNYIQVLTDIDKVTKEEIIKASKMFTLDTIYLLRSFPHY